MVHILENNFVFAVADPGFPVGGDADPLGGGANLRRVHFSAKTYVKTKKIDPVGGGGGGGAPAAPPLDPPMIWLYLNKCLYASKPAPDLDQ